MASENYKSIEILSKYYDQIERIVAQSSQFETVSDYVNYVLGEMLFGQNESGYTKEEEEIIKKRLDDLGYM
ncbi:CopG family transcriptional regulator [candidate division KSB1 bacterium]|nr:CopG family transcriptional regulator [candidate division KSB1 bacterium]NIR68788.1 CopG family transcriptional regulator [candidate division KSB1 bacterium]NIS28120.1 CopG family transcriptional regulator [candidate division KSB1 bacterium]NIT75016.1 CopG family transcriptional regulator [candidate division KSB1 bacterium]NIU28800.1 CopG family transcriptional regulator [candidate division KSB1 bacterium]